MKRTAWLAGGLIAALVIVGGVAAYVMHIPHGSLAEAAKTAPVEAPNAEYVQRLGDCVACVLQCDASRPRLIITAPDFRVNPLDIFVHSNKICRRRVGGPY